jgi:hypothetical protein
MHRGGVSDGLRSLHRFSIGAMCGFYQSYSPAADAATIRRARGWALWKALARYCQRGLDDSVWLLPQQPHADLDKAETFILSEISSEA